MKSWGAHCLPPCLPETEFTTASNMKVYFLSLKKGLEVNRKYEDPIIKNDHSSGHMSKADCYSPRKIGTEKSGKDNNSKKGHNSEYRKVKSTNEPQAQPEYKKPRLKLPVLHSPNSVSPQMTSSNRNYGMINNITSLENKSSTLPHVYIPGLDKRQNTRDIIQGPEGDIPIPLSNTDRKVTVLRNAMYGNFLRKSTKKLQDDLRHTMRVYSTEKHQLLRQLANLRHEMDELRTSDSSTSPTSEVSDSSRSSKSTHFYHAPNVAANKASSKNGKKEKGLDTELGQTKGRDGILKLPYIADSSGALHPSSEWDSGNILHTNLPPIDQPRGLAAAKALLENSYQIPKNTDPTREDISLPEAKKLQREKKKVHFAAENKITEFQVGYDSDTDKKQQQSYGEAEDHLSHKPHKHHKGSKKGHSDYKAGTKLPSLAPVKKPHDPKEAKKFAAEYKALYVSIQDPEERTKTLADILYAVRMRMQDNEQTLKFGELPKSSKSDHSLCDFLLKTSSASLPQDESPKSDSPKQGKNYLGPLHTAARIGRRSHAIQLQNYLRKMSKSRRMVEHMEAEEYRLAHIIGHKQLMAVSQTTN